jgi:hypothetical protein
MLLSIVLSSINHFEFFGLVDLAPAKAIDQRLKVGQFYNITKQILLLCSSCKQLKCEFDLPCISSDDFSPINLVGKIAH